MRRSILPGGVRLLTESMPGLRSAAIGLWMPVGSRDEANGHYGSTHFLEHLLFKGTKRRTAFDIAEAFDAVGGESNAATTKEHTCYYARVLDADLPMAVDVLADMVTSAVLDPAEFELERGVILEELAMSQDDPHDVAHEAFATVIYGENPLGRPVGGTPETITAVPREAVWRHYEEHYRPDRLVVTAAGSVDHDTLAAQLSRVLTDGGWELDPHATPSSRRPNGTQIAAQGDEADMIVTRQVEQAQVILGCVGISALDERRYDMNVLSAILGGGMSSRLFQEVRERHGLAYSTYSFASGHADSGSFGLYAGCAPKNIDRVTQLLRVEWDKLVTAGVTPEELVRAKGQLSGGMMLGLEDTSARMTRLGASEIILGELYSQGEMLEKIQAVSAEDVQSLAQELAERPWRRVVVTP